MPHATGQSRPWSGQILRWKVAQVPGEELPQECGRAYTRGAVCGPRSHPGAEVGSLTERIREYDRKLEEISKEIYPETELLRQVEGIGPLTALTFHMTTKTRRIIVLVAAMAVVYAGPAMAASVSEVEPNDSIAQAQNIDPYFSLNSDPNITDSTTVPHATVDATGNDTFDYYSFKVS